MKDFFYNRSDAIVAVLIILVAAFVIYTRVGIIMDYPSKAAGGEGNAFLPPIEEIADVFVPPGAGADTTVTVPSADAAAENQPAQTADTTPPSDVTPGDAATAAPPEATPPATPSPSATQTTTITVAAGDVGSVIADKLLAAGAITDKAAFLAEVTAQGAESKLKIGTFTIPGGATLSEIVKILVG